MHFFMYINKRKRKFQISIDRDGKIGIKSRSQYVFTDRTRTDCQLTHMPTQEDIKDV